MAAKFRGYGFTEFRVPLAGCRGLRRVVPQLGVLCIALCAADPVFIALFLRRKPNCRREHVLSQTNPGGWMEAKSERPQS